MEIVKPNTNIYKPNVLSFSMLLFSIYLFPLNEKKHPIYLLQFESGGIFKTHLKWYFITFILEKNKAVHLGTDTAFFFISKFNNYEYWSQTDNLAKYLYK